MSDVTTRPEDVGDETCKVIADAFKKQGFEQKHFSAFDEVFRLLLKGYEEDQNINPVLNPEAQIDPEDPESSIGLEYLINRSIELYKVYLRELNDYHSKDFARAFMLRALENDDEPDRCGAKAYLALSNSTEMTMYNPKYAEALLWALRSGKGDIYAAYFSRVIVEDDLLWEISGYLDRSKKYSAAYGFCLKANKSSVYAQIYAERIVDEDNGISPRFADIYAGFYERLINEGISHNVAVEYAFIFIEELSNEISYLEGDDKIKCLNDVFSSNISNDILRISAEHNRRKTYVKRF